jgi:hypothetical protein
MHTSGKVFAWLAVVGAAAAIFMSSKALAVRSAWMNVAQKNEADIQKNQETILARTRELDSKRGDLARTMYGWDRYWNDIDARIDQQGMLTLANLGTSSGVKPEQVLFVFALNPEGHSKFVGNFRVTKPNEVNCVARPNWFLFAGNPVAGQFKARVRTMIPNQYQARLGALDQQILAADQIQQTNTAELERQVQLTERTDKLIESRLSEIEGAPDLAGRNLPPENVKGLLTAIVHEEGEWHTALREADRLRRELKRTREQFAATIDANRQLTDKLPQPESYEPTVGAATR